MLLACLLNQHSHLYKQAAMDLRRACACLHTHAHAHTHTSSSLTASVRPDSAAIPFRLQSALRASPLLHSFRHRTHTQRLLLHTQASFRCVCLCVVLTRTWLAVCVTRLCVQSMCVGVCVCWMLHSHHHAESDSLSVYTHTRTHAVAHPTRSPCCSVVMTTVQRAQQQAVVPTRTRRAGEERARSTCTSSRERSITVSCTASTLVSCALG